MVRTSSTAAIKSLWEAGVVRILLGSKGNYTDYHNGYEGLRQPAKACVLLLRQFWDYSDEFLFFNYVFYGSYTQHLTSFNLFLFLIQNAKMTWVISFGTSIVFYNVFRMLYHKFLAKFQQCLFLSDPIQVNDRICVSAWRTGYFLYR